MKSVLKYAALALYLSAPGVSQPNVTLAAVRAFLGE
jgi:hypothetical protein